MENHDQLVQIPVARVTHLTSCHHMYATSKLPLGRQMSPPHPPLESKQNSISIIGRVTFNTIIQHILAGKIQSENEEFHARKPPCLT